MRAFAVDTLHFEVRARATLLFASIAIVGTSRMVFGAQLAS
jgi:hypothetical protein